MRLPIRRGVRPAHAPAEVPAPSPVLADRRVLVVDDNTDAAESLGMLLKLLGADVKIVHDGPDALAALPVHQPGGGAARHRDAAAWTATRSRGGFAGSTSIRT